VLERGRAYDSGTAGTRRATVVLAAECIKIGEFPERVGAVSERTISESPDGGDYLASGRRSAPRPPRTALLCRTLPGDADSRAFRRGQGSARRGTAFHRKHRPAVHSRGGGWGSPQRGAQRRGPLLRGHIARRHESLVLRTTPPFASPPSLASCPRATRVTLNMSKPHCAPVSDGGEATGVCDAALPVTANADPRLLHRAPVVDARGRALRVLLGVVGNVAGQRVDPEPTRLSSTSRLPTHARLHRARAVAMQPDSALERGPAARPCRELARPERLTFSERLERSGRSELAACVTRDLSLDAAVGGCRVDAQCRARQRRAEHAAAFAFQREAGRCAAAGCAALPG
jgi:hypothetical protein